uniref:Putative papilin n=1 Tax=Ixodes ricinus TaxID=34613 RepID=V5HCR8_IXORI
MKTIVLTICFGVATVCAAGDDVTKNVELSNGWTTICSDAVNISCVECNLTWWFDNKAKDCKPGSLCPTTKNTFPSIAECNSTCLQFETMCNGTKPDDTCSEEDKKFTWRYENGSCTRNKHCGPTVHDFTTERQCKIYCMNEKYPTICKEPKHKQKNPAFCSDDKGDDFDQRWYFHSTRNTCKLSFAYFYCDEEGNRTDPENSDKGNNFFSPLECELACMR